DLERITNMAFAMVAEYGMSEEIGYLSLKDSQNPENSYGFNKKYSQRTSERIDDAVSKIVQKNYERTKKLLMDHKEELEKMAKTLLEKEVLDHNDLRELLGDHPEGKYPEGIFKDEYETAKVNGKPSKAETVKENLEEENAAVESESASETEGSEPGEAEESDISKE
ncbi:MAG: AAA family ATPase, partial [Balneolaceae bacterium]|nr:AAA family ATPase [Balneolaceae bacterium]